MASPSNDVVSAPPVLYRRLAVAVIALVFLGATAAVARVASRPVSMVVQAEAPVTAPPTTAASTTTLPTTTMPATTVAPVKAPITAPATIPVTAPPTTRPRPVTTVPATTPATVARPSAPTCSSQMTLLGISRVSLPGVYQSQMVICERDPAAYYRCRSYMVTTLAIMNSGEGEAAMLAAFDRLLACTDS